MGWDTDQCGCRRWRSDRLPPSARMTATASQNSEKHQKLSRTSRTGELWLRLPPLLLLLMNHTNDIFKISFVHLISLR